MSTHLLTRDQGRPGLSAADEPVLRVVAGAGDRISFETDDAAYARLAENARTVGTLLTDALSAEGVPHVVQYAGTMFSPFFTGDPVLGYADAKAAQTWRYPAFFHAMLGRGVHLPPSAYEAWFVSSAHDDRAVEAVLDALPYAAQAAAATQKEA